MDRAEARAASAMDRMAERADRIATAQTRLRDHNAAKKAMAKAGSPTSTAQGDEAEAKRQRLDDGDGPPGEASTGRKARDS